MKLENAVVLVTGANRGLGLAFAKEALARGARKVYAAARNPDSITLEGVIPVKLDVTNKDDIAKLVEELSKLTVLEAADLAKALEEAWGVSAAAAVAVAAAPAAAAEAEQCTGRIVVQVNTRCLNVVDGLANSRSQQANGVLVFGQLIFPET